MYQVHIWVAKVIIIKFKGLKSQDTNMRVLDVTFNRFLCVFFFFVYKENNEDRT